MQIRKNEQKMSGECNIGSDLENLEIPIKKIGIKPD